jgi:hypothetical protein
MNWKACGRKRACYNIRLYPEVYLVGQRKPMKDVGIIMSRVTLESSATCRLPKEILKPYSLRKLYLDGIMRLPFGCA